MNVFDIPLLAGRVANVADWTSNDPDLAPLPLGLFGASTGAAAALWAAADLGDRVRAVVSRGGRPDLAAPRLAAVHAPVLLIVGGRDEAVLALNREAQQALGAQAELVVVPGATHLFEEPGALEAVARLAAEWLGGGSPAGSARVGSGARRRLGTIRLSRLRRRRAPQISRPTSSGRSGTLRARS